MTDIKTVGTHTPGPWFITGRMTKYVEARITGGLTQEVAACGPTDADGGYGPQQQANAQLICAAPDLLEALEALKDAFIVVVGDKSPYARFALERPLLAIARARGEA